MNTDMDDFDIGPLTWVKAELDNALSAAREALAGWNGEDLNPLKAAAAYLHQVYGAVQIVDLQGVSLLTAETEHLLNDMSHKVDKRHQAAADAALAAIEALKDYLDGLMAGAPHAELKLTPVYRAVVAQRGGEPPAPSELFFPNTDARPPKRANEVVMDDRARSRAIHAARVIYQRGLLQLLQNKEPMAGLMLMDQAVRKVEGLAPSAAQYAFWWTTAALIDALRREGVPADLLIKRVCGRIDLQMRRLMEGSRQLAERLFRDVLYYVAQDAAPSGRSADVRQLFQLQRYFPAPETGPSAEQRPFIASLKENLGHAKDHWIRYCGGRAESLEPFQQAATSVFEAAVRLPNQAMKDLARIIQAVAKRMPGVGDASHNEALQVEMATALLLGQNAVEHYEALDEEFARQAEAQAMRVQAAIDPSFNLASIPQVDMLDEISRTAQEKLLLAQVTHEIQANLHQVEEILDKFFRNAQERGGLPKVPALLKQILGALNILQLDVASQLVSETMTRIGHFNEVDLQIPPENLNWVAEALSTLGLYVDALRYGRGDPKEMARLLATPEVEAKPKEISVEALVREEAQRLREAVGQWVAGGGDEAGKLKLKADLTVLGRDAELIGDGELRTQANNLMKALDSTADQAGTAASAMAPATRVAPSAQAQRLAEASSEVVDRELLETYIEEANEVLGAIAVQVSRLHVSPYDNEAFTVVRRGFHTLKGSGRMVGLTDLAEPAWEVEQTLNQWLRDERAPSAEMLAFLEEAGNVFQVWVHDLEAQGHARVEPGHLVGMARRLRGEEVGSASMVPETPPPKAEAGVSAAQTAAAGETEPQEPVPQPEEDVDVGGHVLPAELFYIFMEEAEQRLEELGSALTEMAHQHRPAAWGDFSRAAHTLAGISRTTGFTPLAEAAHAVELWSGAWPDKTQDLPPVVVAGLESVLALLSEAYKEIVARRFPLPLEQVATILAGLRGEGTEVAESPQGPPGGKMSSPAEAPVEPAAEATAVELEEGGAVEPHPAAATTDVLSDTAAAATEAVVASDELDENLLPIFLEEADELLPRIGESLRHWRAQPDDPEVGDALKRVLHTLKGSARMAGAMSVGERVHALETEVMEQAYGVAMGGFLDHLEEAYDQIYDMVERLKAGPDTLVEQHALSTVEIADAEAEVEREVRDILEHIPAPTSKAPSEPEMPVARDELDEQLLPIFLEEADELLARIAESLRYWRTQPADPGVGTALKRALHTLKGSARMAGAMVLGERVHGLEAKVMDQTETAATDAFLDDLDGDYNQIHDMVEQLKAGHEATMPATPAPAPTAGAAEQAAQAAQIAPAPAAKASLDDELRLRQALRLKSDVLDILLNEAGEISIARARIENVLKGYKQTAQELAANVERLRAQLRELEIQAESQMHSRLSQMDESHFDPLEFDRFSRLQELTRHLAESVNDVSTAQDNLLAGLTEADSALIQQSRMARTLQQELMHMRMVPLNSLSERLYRIVRQSAKETGRRAQLELEGGQTELDRVVLDKIAAPLEHLVRNAVAHGIELPAARQAAGKPEYGEVRLTARQEGNEIVLTLADDGGGVNAEAVRARAVERGWLQPDQAITPEQVETFLFRSGFSTAEKVTELAGRGVGLDVVKNEIAGIGGRVRMESTPGAGARFVIRLPLTLALTQVVLAVAGEQTWALPANLVTLVREVKLEQVHDLHEQGYVELGEERFPLRTLAELVDCVPQPAEGRFRTLLLLKAGESRLALRVDAMEGNFEAVVKPTGPQLARIAGISGATVLGDGRVALILNPFQLAERAPPLSVAEEEALAEQPPLIMVVDDSLTVRKITSRFLQREGYRVSTARDGVEALEMLQEELPALMLLDIEMPRMDGFEVTQHVRNNKHTADLPIIMITSRTADKHRDHALELGVNSYLGKPYQEEELLAEIKRLAVQTEPA